MVAGLNQRHKRRDFFYMVDGDARNVAFHQGVVYMRCTFYDKLKSQWGEKI